MAKKNKPDAAGTPATVALTRSKITYSLHPYRHQPDTTSYGEEAAEQLGIDPGRIFKTLVAEVGDRLVVAVVPVAGRLDLKALAQALGGKNAAMADADRAARSSGYVLGGISPIGQRTRLATVIDSSARNYETIFVSAGRRGLQVELSPDDLIVVTDASTADIAG
ncbi:Cys-tRNA(Pro) deacylase [Microlunatus elymi]|uniref:Cys-tRNA(Pro)/Cys-tRNA(Cys) deacylase n=1 Tax=Microlunatus elymi TaxID=2596828 RepID=A0A516Q0J7_9ACTN|nr:Cys-tRNA(Pro) deacylase [Microlunatus elymi]QDP96954.1 Cys-tRNA(Pro) deacylase [Microlunatus elymi]